MVTPMTRAALLCLILSACGQFPALDAAYDPNAVTPPLLPTDELTAALPKIDPADPLAARTAALQARAAALRNR
jgi:hypothetical protein